MNFRKMLWLFIAFCIATTTTHAMKRQSRRIFSNTFAPTIQTMYKRNYTNLLKISSNITRASTLESLSDDIPFEQTPTGCDITGWADDKENPSIEQAIQKITGDKNEQRVAQYANLMNHFMRDEKKNNSDCITLYHGMDGQTTTSALFRTILAKYQQRKRYKNFFLLRDINDCEYARKIDNATEWAMEEFSTDIGKHKMADILYDYKFDHDQERSKLLLSTSISAIAHADEGFQEDSFRFIYNQDVAKEHNRIDWVEILQTPLYLWAQVVTLPIRLVITIGDRFSSNKLAENYIENTLVSQGFDKHFYEKYEADFCNIAHAIKGSLLQISIPKQFAKPCIYTSGPIGKPLKLFSAEKHTCDSGNGEWDEIESLTETFKNMRLMGYHFIDPELKSIYYPRYAVQARVLLNPEYFENPESGIRMKMYCAADEQAMNKAIERLHEIAREVTRN